jgi:hypothetical protein
MPRCTSGVVGRVAVLSEKRIHNAPNARAASNIFITEIIKFLFMENKSKIIIGIFVKKTCQMDCNKKGYIVVDKIKRARICELVL